MHRNQWPHAQVAFVAPHAVKNGLQFPEWRRSSSVSVSD
jgi:hypothetical protein